MGSTTELRINLGSLKRQDPYIEKIIDTSTHVAVYSFNPQLNEWEKTEVEGSLFVYSRVAPPYWGFTILNRLSMDNLTEPLTSQLEFQTQNPFLLYRNAKLLIYGIWFYDQDDCKRIGELLQKLCAESSRPLPNNLKTQKVKLFGGGDGLVQVNGPTPKLSSPTANSVNSVSPGSSVGGANRPLSNGEAADSESDDKEVAHTNNGSINILDLLSKAQDKYEKKRNTPDPGTDNVQSGTEPSPVEVENPLVKPVPVKASHPQKLDVATLFKQPALPSDAKANVLASKGHSNPVPNTAHLLSSIPAMNPQHAGMPVQPVVQSSMPVSTANVGMLQQRRAVSRPMGRSYSMNEAMMRQHADAYMSGNVVSVEEIEAGLSHNSSAAASNQQQINSTLDRMIDRINNSAGVLPTNLAVVAQPTPLPGIQEAGLSFAVGGTPAGLGTRLPSSVRVLPQTHAKPIGDPRQRSMSSSAMPPSNPVRIVASSALPPNAQFTPNFTALPNLPLHNTNLPKHPVAQLSTVPPTYLPHSVGQPLFLHGNAVATKQTTYCTTVANALASITTAVSSVAIKDQVPKVVATLPQVSKSSPALATTLLSPEDFQLSSAMQPKKAQPDQSTRQEVSQGNQTPSKPPLAATPTPLTKEQLRQTLVSLLQKDGLFLTAIHEAYMTNFKPT